MHWNSILAAVYIQNGSAVHHAVRELKHECANLRMKYTPHIKYN